MRQSFPLPLLLLLMVTIEQCSCNLFDLEDVAYAFLVQNCSNSERLVTFDITGDNKTRGLNDKVTMHTHPPVTIKVGPVKYGSAQVQSRQLSAVYVQTFHNNQSDVVGKAHISEQVEHEDEYTWTVTKGLEFTTKVKFSVNVPLVYQFSSEFSTSVKTTSGSTTVETQTTRQLIQQDVIIPPGATIEARWYVNEAQVVVPWESEIYLEGTVAALFETPNKALTWKYFNVTDIKHKDLEVNGTSVRFRAKGLFQANVAQSYHLSTKQKDLTHRTARLAKYIFEQES
uniref:Putative salivary secreted cytotoxin n=1 Tax=Ixodes ricinus TaxID=34613 RepID=A0A6B0V7C3_IXORI